MVQRLVFVSALAAIGAVGGMQVTARTDARMFRYPAVSATQIAFVYAGDIWIVPRAGGAATRLSSPRGEESFPRFDSRPLDRAAAPPGAFVLGGAGRRQLALAAGRAPRAAGDADQRAERIGG